MNNTESFINTLKNDPQTNNKLRELELQLKDLQDARESANKETGWFRLTRPILAVLAHIAIGADIIALNYIESGFTQQVLTVMLIILVWDIRQIYKFYFGSSEQIEDFFLKNKKFKN